MSSAFFKVVNINTYINILDYLVNMTVLSQYNGKRIIDRFILNSIKVRTYRSIASLPGLCMGNDPFLKSQTEIYAINLRL